MSFFKSTLGRSLVVAFVLALLLLALIVALDFFGDQPQPFQYLLH